MTEAPGIRQRRGRPRPVQYVHTIVEPDHRAITGRVNATQGVRDVQAARRTIQGDEAMHMIRKGHARWVSGLAVRQQRPCIHHLSVSNSSSGRRWKLDHAPAVGDPTHMVEFGTGRRAFAREA